MGRRRIRARERTLSLFFIGLNHFTRVVKLFYYPPSFISSGITNAG
jgi:hypothetical protein